MSMFFTAGGITTKITPTSVYTSDPYISTPIIERIDTTTPTSPAAAQPQVTPQTQTQTQPQQHTGMLLFFLFVILIAICYLCDCGMVTNRIADVMPTGMSSARS